MRFNILSAAALLAPLFATTSLAAGCNGDVRLCDRLYSNITMIGAHNSPFVGDLPSQNQHLSVTDQLDLGIRFFTAQVHDTFFSSFPTLRPHLTWLQTHNLFNLNTLYLCHTSCWLLNQGPLLLWLRDINNWMNTHPSEVVTILLTNPTRASPDVFKKAIERAGLGDKVFTPERRDLGMDDWPTLQEMIDSRRRLVVLLDYGADQSRVSWLLDEFAYFWESPFSQTDPTFSQCRVDRPHPNTETGNRFSLINHTLNLDLLPGDDEVLVPHSVVAEETNSRESIMGQIGLCQAAHGKTPNVVLLDYVDKGNVIATQNILNNLG